MNSPVEIHVEGDAYLAFFFIPMGQLSLKGLQSDGARAHLLPVGAEYIYRAIKAACAPQDIVTDKSLVGVKLTRRSWGFSDDVAPLALYEIGDVGTIPDFDDEKTALPLLRLSRSETQEVAIEGIAIDRKPVGDDLSEPPEHPDLLVNWFGELAGKRAPRKRPDKAQSCGVHIQVGLASPFDELDDCAPTICPKDLAKPDLARIVVVNVGELSAAHRIRRSLSYEAIAVDLLRFLRGTNAEAAPQNPLVRLSMADDDAAPQSVLVVRLNNSAVFLYACSHDSANGSKEFREIGAWLLCHKKECAPLSQPELGQMVGYTGFVSAQVAAAVANQLHSEQKDEKSLRSAVVDGVRRSLAWQRASFERGCFHMFYEKKENNWVATPPRVGASQNYYDKMLADIVRMLNAQYRETAKPLEEKAALKEQLAQFDDGFANDVLTVEVQINRAVAHRTQWFMARSLAAVNESGLDIKDTKLETRFLEIALGWLSETNQSPGCNRSPGLSVPIVRIGKAELTDRREVEDFLAIHQALGVYARAHDGKPLNIAVFGSPGAGKSYAVRQVVHHIGETNKNRFKADPLTFNLAQFTSLDDLPAALHLVRNECLHGGIPIVFFDEFDSSFNGQPFGWLKYFLAPMQDGEFYHAGQKFKLGNAVFVFAGGVNRSFEELNGRVRNPGFCEAKGPDFISRLKAHLNVQGINKSEPETDQFRYILRRGILLRGLTRDHLRLREVENSKGLFHRSVANALLRLERFKHGVRSLEAIIKMCAVRSGHPIGPSDLPSMDQLEMHVDAMKLLGLVDEYAKKPWGNA